MVAKMLISTIDDAYTDSQMLIAYMEEAERLENPTLAKFFKNCAERRLAELEEGEKLLKAEVKGMCTDKTSMDAYIHNQWSKYRADKLDKMKDKLESL